MACIILSARSVVLKDGKLLSLDNRRVAVLRMLQGKCASLTWGVRM